MDDPFILYFVLNDCLTSALDNSKIWIVTLDMKSRTILRCDGIGAYPSDGDAGMASYNIFGNCGFFPSEFSKYLKKLSTRDTDEAPSTVVPPCRFFYVGTMKVHI
nr:uncharacterized protein LOC127312313 [Lolium perenne]